MDYMRVCLFVCVSWEDRSGKESEETDDQSDDDDDENDEKAALLNSIKIAQDMMDALQNR